ncbi:MAG: hypothetical protein C0399_04030 [Syntrophus sp. (in: bacteria)]|nr:hypothetical protein [Syntrophus sp. (in: bacteria)]
MFELRGAKLLVWQHIRECVGGYGHLPVRHTWHAFGNHEDFKWHSITGWSILPLQLADDCGKMD